MPVFHIKQDIRVSFSAGLVLGRQADRRGKHRLPLGQRYASNLVEGDKARYAMAWRRPGEDYKGDDYKGHQPSVKRCLVKYHHQS